MSYLAEGAGNGGHKNLLIRPTNGRTPNLRRYSPRLQRRLPAKGGWGRRAKSLPPLKRLSELREKRNTTKNNNITTFLCNPNFGNNNAYYCTFSLTLIKHSTNVQESDIYPGCRLFSG